MRQQHKTLFDFWGLPEPSRIDSTVHVHLDPSVITQVSQKGIDDAANLELSTAEERLNMGFEGKTSMSEAGLNSTFRKIRRQTTLSNLISAGKIKTMREAMSVPLDAEIDAETYELPARIEAKSSSYQLITSYLNAIGKQLLDDETNELVGSTVPIIIDYKGNVVRTHYKFYDGDPLKGGKEITHAEYRKLMNDLAQKVKNGELK